MDVRTTTGIVRGYQRNNMMCFLGIPYAEAPLGELRFKRAVPKKPWDGVYEANRIVNRSLQVFMGQVMGSEDCLYMNIKCPLSVEADGTDRKLPVLFWIHGGGYNTGGMEDETTNGACFVRDGIVFVEIQYRLNLAGFFDFGVLPGCEFVESNRGLSDMITAIQWMHENIAAFGGDPDRVTIMGESAGGAAVTTLMAVPSVKGMFSQVIAESSLPNCVQSHEVAKTLLYAWMKENNWKEADMPDLIQGDLVPLVLSAEYIQHQSQDIDPGTLLPCPCIDDLLPEYPIDAIANGCARDVRLILGTNLHEGTMFVNPFMHVFPNSWEMIQEMFQKAGYEERFEGVKAYYDRPDVRYPEEISPFVNFATDYAFKVPGTELANAQSKYGDTWLFHYEFVAEGALRQHMLASHAFELAFVYETYDASMPWGSLYDTPVEIKENLADAMHGSWVNFIKSGAPSDNWPKMTGYNTPIRIFDKDTTTRQEDRSELMKLWEGMRFFR
ncbi:MAG: carboxylesterase/lipase family protein [Blautia sp.]|nr:carboxylesterase/lipase family protein [Blautia sp.]